MSVKSLLLGTFAFLQNALTTAEGNGTAYAVPRSSNRLNVYVKTTGVISTGTLVIEEADSATYAGTWSVLQTIDLTLLTGGDLQVVHITGLVSAIRARMSVAITGGGSVAVSALAEQ